MKIRIKFSKQGAMKFIGHLDTMRYFQKAMRRADVDIRYSEGFSPHQIMSFAAPLGVGLTGSGEYLDIEVLSTDSSAGMVKRLNDTMVEGVEVLSYRKLPDDAENAMSIVAACDYTIVLRDDYENGLSMTPEEFYNGILDFIENGNLNIVKKTKKGTKEKLVELAKENAWMVLSKDRERIKREEGRTIGAVKEIEDWLGLKDIVRMEAYDISNISGFESVGSMVVYEKGKPKRSDYRKFKIKWVQGPNDYASMEEVLTRRFTHESKGEYDSFSILPDLILMDGGRGQVNIARKVLGELGIDIPVCGMVKDDRHRTRGLLFHEQEIRIPLTSEGFSIFLK